MSDSLSASFLYNNPVVGREIRIRLRPGKMAASGFIYGLIQVLILWLAYLLHSEPWARAVEFGSIAFFLLTAGNVLIFSLWVPMSALGFLDRERKDRSLDQFLVTGYSPYRALLGKLWISFAYHMVILTVSLPFAVLCHALGGVSIGLVIRTYVVLIFFIIFLLHFSISLTTQLPDLAAALLTGPGVLLVLILAHAENTPPALRALSPMNPVFLEYANALGPGVPFARDGTFFGAPVAPWVLSVSYFLGLSILSAFVAIMGPEIPILTGLHIFGGNRGGNSKRKRTRSIFTRSSEIAFLYENRPGWLRRNDLVFREGVIGIFLIFLFLALMGSLWPEWSGFFEPAQFLYPIVLFSLILLPLLSLTGLRGQRAFAQSVKLGRRVVSAVAVSRVAFLAKAAIPIVCLWVAILISDRTAEELEFSRFIWTFCVGITISLLLFCLFLVISIHTRSPGRALAIGCVIGAVITLAPLAWFPAYKGFVVGPDTHFVAELSPFVAVFGAIQPDQSISVQRWEEGDGAEVRSETCEFYPSPGRFLLIYIPLSLIALIASDRTIRKRISKAAPAVAAMLLLTAGPAVFAQEEKIRMDLEVGFDGVLPGFRSGTTPTPGVARPILSFGSPYRSSMALRIDTRSWRTRNPVLTRSDSILRMRQGSSSGCGFSSFRSRGRDWIR